MQINLDEVFFRPEWMRHPLWRWQTVLGYLADPNSSVKSASGDKFLYEGAQYYRDRKYVKNTKILYKKYPEIYIAQELYSGNRPLSWRWFMEALLITGISDEEVVKALKVNCSPDVIKTYRKLYFDVESYLDSEIAVTANIFSSCRSSVNDGNDYDLTWKMFAYNYGADAFMEQFCSRTKKISRKYRDWFKEFSQSRLTVYSFHLTNDMRMTYNTGAIELLKVGKENWLIPEEATKTGDELVKKDFVGSILGHVDMCLLSAQTKLDAVEPRLSYDYTKIS